MLSIALLLGFIGLGVPIGMAFALGGIVYLSLIHISIDGSQFYGRFFELLQ